MWKKTLYVGSVAVLVIVVVAMLVTRNAGAPGSSGANEEKTGKLQVVTTLFPLYDMARAVGGDDADVTLLLPPGMSAHSFEPKPSDIVRIGDADVFVYTGAFMEPWVEETLHGIDRGSLRVVDGSEGVLMIAGEEEQEEHDASEAHEVGHEHEHDGNDPHIWLDFDNAALMATHIAEAFAEADPERSVAYANRVAEYIATLGGIDRDYATTLSRCTVRTVVSGGHRAFGYLTHRYGLGYVAAQGVSSDTEPTAGDLAALVEQVKRERVTHVFSEALLSPKVAETLAAETGVGILSLNPGGNLSKEAFDRGTTFFDILRADLESLSVGLGCQS